MWPFKSGRNCSDFQLLLHLITLTCRFTGKVFVSKRSASQAVSVQFVHHRSPSTVSLEIRGSLPFFLSIPFHFYFSSRPSFLYFYFSFFLFFPRPAGLIPLSLTSPPPIQSEPLFSWRLGSTSFSAS